jgi:hypothetical protein
MTVAREEGVGALWKGITPGNSRRPGYSSSCQEKSFHLCSQDQGLTLVPFSAQLKSFYRGA